MILIVDDDTVVANVFARGVRKAGFEAWVAATADEGLEKAKIIKPRAIVLDFRMPLMDGLGFLYRLRAAETDRRTPVVVVTGEPSLSDEVRAQFDQLGAHVSFKPITPNQLIEAIRLALGETPSAHQRMVW